MHRLKWLQRNGKTKLFIFVVSALIIVVAILIALPKDSSTIQKPVGFQTHLDAHGLSVSSKIVALETKTPNKIAKITAGDVANFAFTIKNDGEQSAKSVSLDTGIASNLLANIENLKGITGLSKKDGLPISVENLMILPHETLVISFDATTLFSSEDYTIHVQPIVLGPDREVAIKGAQSSIIVSKKSAVQPAIENSGEQQ